MSVVLLILGLLLFISLVVVHELGHFVMARRGGVEVEEFGIGFPPRAWKKRLKSGLLLTINWLPLGGFVRLKGEHSNDRARGSYGAAPLKIKIKIMLAGVGMNLLAALALFTFLAFVGMPKLLGNQFSVPRDTKTVSSTVLVGGIEPGSPAAGIGLKPTDKLLSLRKVDCAANCSPKIVNGVESLRPATQALAGQRITLTYVRDNQRLTADVRLRTQNEVEASQKTGNPKGYLGIVPTGLVLQRSTWSAPVVAVGVSAQIVGATFKGLASALAGLVSGHAAQASQQVAGPVGIFVILKDGSGLGYRFVLMIIAVISLTLAIMNVLPIPALDGGRLFVTLLFRALKKPLRRGTEDWIHGTGFALLMLLFILITVVDVRRFF